MLPHHMLVVDDDAAMCDLLLDLFTFEGYRVTACATIEAASRVVAADPPTVVVLDYMFGGQPLGMVWLRALRTDAATRFIPVIFCTAMLRLAPSDSAYIAAHEIPVLAKPFLMDEALQMVQDVLEAR